MQFVLYLGLHAFYGRKKTLILPPHKWININIQIEKDYKPRCMENVHVEKLE